MTLNVDFDQPGNGPTDALKQQILAQLSRLEINCDNIICDTQAHEALDALKVSSLPAAIIYDAEGQVVKRFEGDLDFRSEVMPLIDQLLTE